MKAYNVLLPMKVDLGFQLDKIYNHHGDKCVGVSVRASRLN